MPSKPQKRVTQSTIAKNLGLHRTTVSICLNNSPLSQSLRPEVREKIREEAIRLNYQPNFFATQLGRRKSKIILACAMRLQDYHASLILESFERKASEHGYRVLVSCFATEADPVAMVREMVGSGAASCLALITRAADWFPRRELDTLMDEGVHVVFVGRHDSSDRITQVFVDEEKCAKLAVRHLHRRFPGGICLVTSNTQPPASSTEIAPRLPHESQSYRQERLRLLQKTLREAGLDATAVLAIPQVEDDLRPAETARALLAAFGQRPLPGSFLCTSDVLAWGVLRGLHDLGVAPGVTVGVMGYDDLFPSLAMSPPLTAIHQPAREIGSLGAELLIRCAEDHRSSGRRKKLSPRLVVRESTDGIRQG